MTDKTTKRNKEDGLKPLCSIIQVCRICGKIDAFKGDNHICDRDFQEYRTGINN